MQTRKGEFQRIPLVDHTLHLLMHLDASSVKVPGVIGSFWLFDFNFLKLDGLSLYSPRGKQTYSNGHYQCTQMQKNNADGVSFSCAADNPGGRRRDNRDFTVKSSAPTLVLIHCARHPLPPKLNSKHTFSGDVGQLTWSRRRPMNGDWSPAAVATGLTPALSCMSSPPLSPPFTLNTVLSVSVHKPTTSMLAVATWTKLNKSKCTLNKCLQMCFFCHLSQFPSH